MSITVEDAKRHMNVTSNDDDALIAAKIAAAAQWIGAFIGTPLAEFDPVPEPIKEAVRQLVAHLYENREATLVGVTMNDVSPGLFDLLAPFRRYVF